MAQRPTDSAPSGDAAGSTSIVILVVRSGGIGGLRRQWRVAPPTSDSSRWIALIDDCPWDDAGGDPAGADRYVWRISAVEGDGPPREAELPESRLDGPWRTLIDEVRAASPRTPRAPRA